MAYSDSTVTYLSVDELLQRESGLVSPAHAPDGLPLLINVDAPPTAESLLWYAGRSLGMEGAMNDFKGTPLEPVADTLTAILKQERTQNLVMPDGGTVTVLILPTSLHTLCGRTLLERLLLPWHSTMPGALADTRAAMPTPAAAGPPTLETPPPQPGSTPLPRFEVGDACLALPLDGSPAVVTTRRRGANGWPQYSAKRRFTEERLDSVAESEMEFALPYRTERLPASDHVRYHALLAQSPAGGEWIVPRSALVRVIADLARSLNALHAAGEVHGDLKPANILLTAAGPATIDSLGLRDGERAPAMTRGWAAPEQILGLPVSPKTDQYAIGMLLLEVVGGVLFGEEAQITVPVGGRATERHTLLRNPGVFIDPESAPVVRESVADWRDLIERCVRFESGERLESMLDLADCLDALSGQKSLTGEYRTPLYFGSRVTARRTGGDSGPGWLA